jgi:hypothetical protein
MNTDPTGTQGATKSRDDLSVVFDGGPDFLSRVRQFEEKKRAADEAFERLRLGKEAQAALADARRDREAAVRQRSDADKILADATAKAAKVVADAEALKAEHERRLGDVQAREQQAATTADVARKAAAIANAARGKAEAKEKEFNGKIDRLRAELSAVSAEMCK